MHSTNSVSAISMVRVVSLLHINFGDVTYTLPLPLMWSIVEEQIAIVAGNLPLLRRVFSMVFPARWLASSRRGTTGASKGFSGRQRSTQNYSLTRMDVGTNNSEIASERTKNKGQTSQITRWSDDGIDGRSDTELASNAAAPDGIRMWKDFRVESTK